jgi:hypothetical protein
MSEVKTNKVSPVGANGTVTLGDSGDTITIPAGATITNSGTATGFGKVLQIQYFQTATQQNTTSNTFAASQLTKAITPSSSSSKIMVQMTCQVSNADGNPPKFIVYRGGSPASGLIGSGATSNRQNATVMGNNSLTGYIQPVNFTLFDEPATTSATTYTVYWASYSNSSATWMNKPAADGDYDYTLYTQSSLILWEIAG